MWHIVIIFKTALILVNVDESCNEKKIYVLNAMFRDCCKEHIAFDNFGAVVYR